MEFDVTEGLTSPRERDLGVGGTVGVVECRARGASTGDGAEIVDGECGVQASSPQIQIRFLEREDLAQVGSFGHLPVDGHVTFSILWADPLPTTPPEVSAATSRVHRRHPKRRNPK